MNSPGQPVALPTAFAVATLGIAVFSVMDAVMKGLVLALGVFTVMTWRSLASVLLSGTLFVATGRRVPAWSVLRIHLIRGGVGTVMAVTFFWGLARVPMAQAIALAFVAPVLSLFLAAAILKERVPRGSIVACVLAAGGIALILVGQARAELGRAALEGTVAILFSAVCYAFNIILMRAQSRVADPIEVAFWQNLVVGTLLAAVAPWVVSLPAAGDWPMIVLAAILSTVSLMLLGWAYRHGPASYLAPTEYTSFVWAAILGWIVFAEPLSPWTLGGAAFIVAGSVIAARGKPLGETA